MNKLTLMLRVFQKGAMVADPTSWKNWQMGLNVLVGFLVAIAILAENMGWIAAGTTQKVAEIVMGLLVALAGANVAGTAATSKKVGVGPKPPMPEPFDAELWDADETLPASPVGHTEPAQSRRRSSSDASRETWLDG